MSPPDCDSGFLLLGSVLRTMTVPPPSDTRHASGITHRAWQYPRATPAGPSRYSAACPHSEESSPAGGTAFSRIVAAPGRSTPAAVIRSAPVVDTGRPCPPMLGIR